MYLDVQGVEEHVADAVLERAEELRVARLKDFFDAMSSAVQRGVARAFGGS